MKDYVVAQGMTAKHVVEDFRLFKMKEKEVKEEEEEEEESYDEN